VGCGCRGQELARGLIADGYLVRGTTRDPERIAAIEAAGAEGVIADPYRLATVTPLLAGVSVVVWLMGHPTGTDDEIAAVNQGRLETLLTKLIDSGVRGLVYEGAGTAPPGDLEGGREMVRQAGDFFRMPVYIVETDSDGARQNWLDDMRAGVQSVLDAP